MKQPVFVLCLQKSLLLFSLFSTVFCLHSTAATYTSTAAGGNWNAAATWTCVGASPCTYPRAGDIVIITGPVTLTAAAAIGGTLSGLTIQTGGNLVLTSNLSSNVTLSGGTLSTSGINAITLTGAITVSSSSNITPVSTAALSVSGSVGITGGTLTYSGGNLTAASLSVGSGTTLNIGTASTNSGRLISNGNVNMLGRLVVNKGGILDASGYNLAVNANVNNPPCNNAGNSHMLVDGVVLVDNLTIEKSCMFISGVTSISTTNPPGFVRVQRDLTVNEQGKMEIAGLFMVGRNVDADQGNIRITGTGYYGVAGTADYSNNSAPVASLNYCQNSSILSCPSTATCPFPNSENTANECNNVCRAYVCSGFFASFPLPVDLLSFSATVEKAAKRISLEWITASETNNDYFAVERSSDGLSFEEIQQVKGAGTTAVMHTYQAFDTNPLPSVNYYRLKQVDLDGTYAYSKIISVLHEQSAITLSPNPADGSKIGINWNRKVEKATICLYNQLGSELYTWQVSDPALKQTIALPKNLLKGVYLVRIHTGTQVFTDKLVVYN